MPDLIIFSPEPQQFTIAVSDRARIFRERQPIVAHIVGTGPQGVAGAAGVAGAQGIQGIQGPGGASITITIGAPALVWTLTHNLGYRPAVATFTAADVEIVGVVSHTSVNVAVVTFALSSSGYATLS